MRAASPSPSPRRFCDTSTALPRMRAFSSSAPARTFNPSSSPSERYCMLMRPRSDFIRASVSLAHQLVEEDPAKLWGHYLLLMAVEEAFKNLKGDLAIRPVFQQLEARIEAHVFIAFLAYCLHVTLARRLHALAPGLTPRSVLEKFAAMQMIDVHLPTADGRELVLTRYSEPEPELSLLLQKLRLELPAQPSPRITTAPKPPTPL